MKVWNLLFSAVVHENERIQKLKPMLIISIFFISIYIICDYFVFETLLYIYIFLLIITICVYVIKRFYMIFYLYTLIYLLLVVPKMISNLGILLQVDNFSQKLKFYFCLQLLGFLIFLIIFYIYFLFYRELRFLYIKQHGIGENKSQSNIRKDDMLYSKDNEEGEDEEDKNFKND